ncbi:hypothetical protein MIB92_14035 [Aestuariirhabdus sp. Z084]|uniref:hypothetical protein n=1 Tax=Aestuariirhabdus haliotis TaxID=2918751 RepID=UPI00201B3F25|nr:hypothetical protein [Aestuariirhabdus haliotis]MCL6416776.1 hypothetical protein [Aestuariirhabdus haliotis]MCL6420759.1 hypothetical protein [Aestuariirhabdus haliotis]
MESRSNNRKQLSTQSNVDKGASRRGFLQKSLIGATPFILTAVSRPVLGNQCTVSGMMSGNLSAPGGPEVCAGLTPGFWKTHLMDWPEPYTPGEIQGDAWSPNSRGATPNLKVVGGTRFNDVFAFRNGYFRNNPSMLEVMQMRGNEDRERLGAHAVAAILNATYFANQSGVSFGYTPDDIISYWNQGRGPGGSNLKKFYEMLNQRGSG